MTPCPPARLAAVTAIVDHLTRIEYAADPDDALNMCGEFPGLIRALVEVLGDETAKLPPSTGPFDESEILGDVVVGAIIAYCAGCIHVQYTHDAIPTCSRLFGRDPKHNEIRAWCVENRATGMGQYVQPAPCPGRERVTPQPATSDTWTVSTAYEYSAGNTDLGGFPYCGPCGSWHPVPTNLAHAKALQCADPKWREPVPVLSNCLTCAHDLGRYCAMMAPRNPDRESDAAVSAWVETRVDRDGRPFPDATGCPGWKAREPATETIEDLRALFERTSKATMAAVSGAIAVAEALETPESVARRLGLTVESDRGIALSYRNADGERVVCPDDDGDGLWIVRDDPFTFYANALSALRAYAKSVGK